MRQFQNATFILDKSEKSFSLQDKKKYDCLMMKFKKYHYPEDIKTSASRFKFYAYNKSLCK